MGQLKHFVMVRYTISISLSLSSTNCNAFSSSIACLIAFHHFFPPSFRSDRRHNQTLHSRNAGNTELQKAMVPDKEQPQALNSLPFAPSAFLCYAECAPYDSIVTGKNTQLRQSDFLYFFCSSPIKNLCQRVASDRGTFPEDWPVTVAQTG